MPRLRLIIGGSIESLSLKILVPVIWRFLAKSVVLSVWNSLSPPMLSPNVFPKFFDNLSPKDWPSPNLVPLSSLPNVVSPTVKLNGEPSPLRLCIVHCRSKLKSLFAQRLIQFCIKEEK